MGEFQTPLPRYAKVLPELKSLSKESDPQLYYEGLLNLGMKLEVRDRVPEAEEIYSTILEALTQGVGGVAGGGPPPERSKASTAKGYGRDRIRPLSRQTPAERELRTLIQRAQERLDAINGVGSSAARIEFNFRRLAHEAASPAGLFAMGAAGAAYRLTKLATLSRLATSPLGYFGRQAIAHSAAFLAETATFTLAGKTSNQLAGAKQDWSSRALAQEWAGGAAMFLGLKVMGRVTGQFAEKVGALGRAPLQQFGMLTGIMLGNRLSEFGHFREHHDNATSVVDSLASLLQFNISGRLLNGVMGEGYQRWEQGVGFQSQTLGGRGEPENGGPTVPPLRRFTDSMSQVFPPDLISPEGMRILHSNILNMNSMRMSSIEDGGDTRRSAESRKNLPPMGIRESAKDDAGRAQELLRNAQVRLQELMPQGKLLSEELHRPAYVEALLECFGITSHSFDQKNFRKGVEIAQRHPERIDKTAFDIDEVYLHWSLAPRDMFRGLFQGRDPALYQNTAPELLDYAPFSHSKTTSLSWWEKIWFRGVQGLLQARMRQHIQFHPGVRAFQLGLRLGQDKNLIMATTGPAGRILLLANEDPAMRMIYFGKSPTETVSIEEVRNKPNIYTREDLVLAMRVAASGKIPYPEDPWLPSYLEMVRRHPSKGAKLKHPALAKLLSKRAFVNLVDDSASTYLMLGGLAGFTVLQPPSARPSKTLNFVLASTHRYLERMSNAYVEALAEALDQSEVLSSRPLADQKPNPADYPHQRLFIEIPWHRFEQEYAMPARELRFLAQHIRRFNVPFLVMEQGTPRAPLISISRERAAAEILPKGSLDADQVSNATDFPYLRLQDGSFQLPHKMTVVVLGDVAGSRTFELASRGHHVIHIEWNQENLEEAERMVNTKEEAARRHGKPLLDLSISYQLGDWYESSAEADLVEAYYPLHTWDIPRVPGPRRDMSLKEFLNKALNSKLGDRGKGAYVVSEFDEIVRDLARLVKQDPSLELLEKVYQKPRPPLVGGFGKLPGRMYHSWLVYRKKV